MLICSKKKLFIFLFFVTLHFSITCCAQGVETKYSSIQKTLVLWTDHAKLKAISLVCLKPGQKPIGIILIPVYTKTKNEHAKTLAELYDFFGRQELVIEIEKRLRMSIPTYFCIDQEALCLASNFIGPLTLFEKKTSMLDVFEGNYTNQESDFQVEIRALAKEMLKSRNMAKIPFLVWIFTTHVETNLNPVHFFKFYQVLRKEGPDILRRETLPGKNTIVGKTKFLDVAPEAWRKTLQKVMKPD